MKNLLIIACHTNSELKKSILIHNIKYFCELCDNIVIINSSECRDADLEVDLLLELNDSLITFEYIPNDKYVCQGKWLYYLNKIDYSIYDNITLTNDSFLITRSLKDYKELINPHTELVGLLESYEQEYHIPDFLRSYNKAAIQKLLKYYETNKSIIGDINSLITVYEVKSTRLFQSRVVYKNETKHILNIHFHDGLFYHHLYHLNYPVIKIKKITNFGNCLPSHLQHYLNVRMIEL